MVLPHPQRERGYNEENRTKAALRLFSGERTGIAVANTLVRHFKDHRLCLGRAGLTEALGIPPDVAATDVLSKSLPNG